jgi:hypothetical protein
MLIKIFQCSYVQKTGGGTDDQETKQLIVKYLELLEGEIQWKGTIKILT